MKIVALVWRIIVIVVRVLVLFLMSSCMLAAIESEFGYFPLTIFDAFSYISEIGIGEILSRCLFTSTTGVYITIIAFTMPVFLFRLIFFGFGSCLQYEITITTKYSDGTTSSFDGMGLAMIAMIIVRLIIAAVLFAFSPFVLLILIIMNIVKLVHQIIDIVTCGL
ncbi:MAG TPA: hypothetical protein VJY54_04465 [Lachnospiraceae bacterium]|nr:hypothetical protein [Lachnospiraceae bacterium]